MWQVVGRLGASLREIEEWWAIDDVLDACEFVDVGDDVAAWGHWRPPPSSG